MDIHELLNPEAVSPFPAHKTAADVEAEPMEASYGPAAQHTYSEQDHSNGQGHTEQYYDGGLENIIAIKELRQINVYLSQLLVQQRARQPDQTKTSKKIVPTLGHSTITKMELQEASRFFHSEWYSGFSVETSANLKTYFLAIAGGQYDEKVSLQVDLGIFQLEMSRVQADHRLELIALDFDSPRESGFRIRNLGVRDQRALPAAEYKGIPITSEELKRREWRIRRNLEELYRTINETWCANLVSVDGTTFNLNIKDCSFVSGSLDALTFLETDTSFPKLRSSGSADLLYDMRNGGQLAYHPDDDTRPVIGHIWEFDHSYGRAHDATEGVGILSFGSAAMILSVMDNVMNRGPLPEQLPVCRKVELGFEAFHFLRSFCGMWPENLGIRTLYDAKGVLRPFTTTQIHIRFLRFIKRTETLPAESWNFARHEGLKIVREFHSLTTSLPNEKGLYSSLSECRISLSFHGIIDKCRPPVYCLVSLRDDGSPSLRVFSYGGINREALRVECRGRAAGLCVFQGLIWAAMEKWQKGWQDVLDLLDNELSISIGDVLDSSRRDELFFGDPFERSKMYFTALELLRNMSEWVAQSCRDIKVFDDMFLGSNPYRFMSPCLESNWKNLSSFVSGVEQDLQQRIFDKHEQIKGLRDGLFNVTTVMEATKSTSLNRHVIVLTIVTVAFLPPSFVATVLNIQAFQKGNVGRTYEIATAVLSLITYFVAIFLVIIVARWKSVKRATSLGAKQIFRSAKTKISVYVEKAKRTNEKPEKVQHDTKNPPASDV